VGHTRRIVTIWPVEELASRPAFRQTTNFKTRLYSTAAIIPIPLLEAEPVERKTISIMKACELVGVSRRTIYNWLSSGKIEYVRTAGGSVRIFVDSLWRDPHNADRPATETVWQQEQRNQA
jgi:excisionase family DNA binding protein